MNTLDQLLLLNMARHALSVATAIPAVTPAHVSFDQHLRGQRPRDVAISQHSRCGTFVSATRGRSIHASPALESRDDKAADCGRHAACPIGTDPNVGGVSDADSIHRSLRLSRRSHPDARIHG